MLKNSVKIIDFKLKWNLLLHWNLQFQVSFNSFIIFLYDFVIYGLVLCLVIRLFLLCVHYSIVLSGIKVPKYGDRLKSLPPYPWLFLFFMNDPMLSSTPSRYYVPASQSNTPYPHSALR